VADNLRIAQPPSRRMRRTQVSALHVLDIQRNNAVLYATLR
jgi:hypothetical protein